MSVFRVNDGTDWKLSVLSAVEEVLSHPLGGKVEISVYPEIPIGSRRIVIHPSLWGTQSKSMQLRMDAD